MIMLPPPNDSPAGPRYVHLLPGHINRCVWLGRRGPHDLYLCFDSAGAVVLVARFGERPLDCATLLLGERKAAELPEPFRTACELAAGRGALP
jgi:hypothetical protein